MKSQFPALFRHHVQPALARAITVEAWLIAADIETWQAGYENVMAIAIARGALHLPDHIWWTLRDWVSGSLLVAVTAAERDYAAMVARLEVVFNDIDECVKAARNG